MKKAYALRNTVATRLRAAGCVFAEDEAALLLSEAKDEAHLSAMVERRVEGLPLEQVMGWAVFCGLRVTVAPGVFVPRRRSELLVYEAAKLARPDDIVVDVGCGSGALGMALRATAPGIKLYATDIEMAAVACARGNLRGAGQVFRGDLLAGLPDGLRGRVNLILANAPYVPTGSLQFMPAEARLYEPQITLDGGADGHDVQRRVAAAARDWLAADGKIIMETSERQAAETTAILAAQGFKARIVRRARLDATVVIARKAARRPIQC